MGAKSAKVNVAQLPPDATRQLVRNKSSSSWLIATVVNVAYATAWGMAAEAANSMSSEFGRQVYDLATY